MEAHAPVAPPQEVVCVVCPPVHYDVRYVINPWMNLAMRVNGERAHQQWSALVANLEAAGARVDRITPVAGLPDMVFVADGGLALGRRFVVGAFRHHQRQPEAGHLRRWFGDRDYEILELDGTPSPRFEGGDALRCGHRLVIGHGFRTDPSAYRQLGRLLDMPAVSIRLVNPRLFHLDQTLCALGESRAMIAPCGWDRAGCRAVARLVREPLVLEDDEAFALCANSVLVGRTVLMPCCPPRVGRVLQRWGYTVCVTPVDEFVKAGGAVRCMVQVVEPMPVEDEG